MTPKDAAALPLKIVADYGKKYPFVWTAAEKFMDMPEGSWDKSRCYIPIAASIAICNLYHMPSSAMFMIPALAAWRQSKEAYTFDQDLAETLYAQATDTKIPSQILMQLPFYCVYIDSGKYRFFCHLENDVNDGRWELRFVRITENDEPVASYLHLGDFTLDEAIMAGHEEAMYQAENIPNREGASKFAENVLVQPAEYNMYADVYNRTVLSEMLQLVLYICADNADIVQSEENKRTYRKPEKRSQVKDKYREVRQWETGYYVGNSLRKERSSAGTGNSERQPYQGGTKRPHMRRGHWHHFWKGKDGNKELVLHWVLPIFVNGDNAGGESPARVTPVK